MPFFASGNGFAADPGLAIAPLTTLPLASNFALPALRSVASM